MKIAIDIDGTINYFDKQFIFAVRELGYGYDSPRFYKEGDWELENYIMGSDNPKQVMAQVCENSSFWMDIPPMIEAIEVLRRLNRKHTLSIVTTPWRDEDKFKTIKIKWMHKYFRFIKESQIVFSSKKWELDIDMIVDDKPTTIDKCREAGIQTICFAHVYNLKVKADYLSANWTGIEKYIDKLVKKGDTL